MRWLFDTGPIKLHWTQDLSRAADKAAAEGRTQVLAYLAESVLQEPCYTTWDRSTIGTSQCQAAAAAGQIKVLSWLLENVESSCWTPNVCLAAVRSNQMDALHWLRFVCDPPCPCDDDALVEAARQGRLDAIQLLRSGQPPCPWSSRVAEAAARHPDCLKWLRQQDPPVPWTSKCMKIAASDGDLSLMKWMRAQDDPCPFDWWCMDQAAARGNLSMVEWLYAHDPSDSKFGFESMSSAAQHGHLEVVQWLRRCSPPCGWQRGDLGAAARQGVRNDEVVQWMLSQAEPCPWQPEVIYTYAAAGNLTMLQWLDKAGYHPDFYAAVIAAKAGHVAVLGWLLGMKDALIEKQQQANAAGVTPRCLPDMTRYPVCVPTLMLWGDHMPAKTMGSGLRKFLQLARATYCALHGLIRWRRNQLWRSSSGKTSNLMADASCDSSARGLQLLTYLAKLPDDLIVRIAVMAELQHAQKVGERMPCTDF